MLKNELTDTADPERAGARPESRPTFNKTEIFIKLFASSKFFFPIVSHGFCESIWTWA